MSRASGVRAWILGFVVLLGGACAEAGPRATEGSADPPGARERLQHAVSATLALDSFTVESRVIERPPDASGGEGMDIYVAPDRLHRTEPSGEELIWIGNTVYLSHPERPGFYYQQEGPEGTPESFFLYLAAALEANDVTQQGSTFIYTSPLGAGEAVVRDGRIISVTWRVGPPRDAFVIAYDLRLFDEAPPVEPPPADRIVSYDDRLPPCDDEQPIPPAEGVPGVFICEPHG